MAAALDNSKMNGVWDEVGHGVSKIVFMVSIKLTGSSNGERRCEWKGWWDGNCLKLVVG